MKLVFNGGALLGVVVFIVLIILASRIISYNLADYYLQSALTGNENALDSVISWQANNPMGSYLMAKRLEINAPEQSEKLVFEALHDNPADARPVAVLARIKLHSGEPADADSLMLLASRMMPANKYLHLRIANYWIERNNLEAAVNEWNKALLISPSLGSQLFPVFVRIFEDDSARAFIKDFAMNPPVWWEAFTVYAVENIKDEDLIVIFQGLRSQSNVPFSIVERKALINRYIKDYRWGQAYVLWVDGLSSSQRSRLAGVYDGSFEDINSNELFGWKISQSRDTETRVRLTYGIHGKSALQIKFNNEEAQYRNLSQNILLPAGEYTFVARTRSEKLEGRGRLKWVLRCNNKNRTTIKVSRAILPSIDWELHTFEFTVPSIEGCQSQNLMLESVGKHLFDHKLTGILWIDNIRIHQ